MKCRVCSCTDDHACEGGCHWVEGEANLCSLCYAAAIAIAEWRERCVRVNPTATAALIREALAHYEPAKRRTR